jgi:hypothetical protein
MSVLLLCSLIWFDVFLQWVSPMADAGVDQYTFHVEATQDIPNICRKIQEAGMKVQYSFSCEIIGTERTTIKKKKKKKEEKKQQGTYHKEIFLTLIYYYLKEV